MISCGILRTEIKPKILHFLKKKIKKKTSDNPVQYFLVPPSTFPLMSKFLEFVYFRQIKIPHFHTHFFNFVTSDILYNLFLMSTKDLQMEGDLEGNNIETENDTHICSVHLEIYVSVPNNLSIIKNATKRQQLPHAAAIIIFYSFPNKLKIKQES